MKGKKHEKKRGEKGEEEWEMKEEKRRQTSLLLACSRARDDGHGGE